MISESKSDSGSGDTLASPASNAMPRVLRALLIIALACTILLLYGSGLHGQRFGDDFDFLFKDPQAKLFYFFWHPNEEIGFYRPLEATINAVAQTWCGSATWLIHATHFLLHALLAAAIFGAIKSFTGCPLSAVIGAGYFTFAQSAVHAVMSNDTVTQMLSSLCGFAAVFAAYAAHKQGGHGRWRYLAASLGAFALALLSKEASMGFLPAIAVVLWVTDSERTGLHRSLLRVGWRLLPFVVIAALYIVCRAQVTDTGPTFGDGTYDFRIGVNIPRNLAQCLIAMLLPVSTVDIYEAVHNRSWPFVIMAASAAAVTGMATLAGLWRGETLRSALLVALVAFLSLLPVLLLNDISELYVYNALPYVALLIGIGIGEWVRRVRLPQPAAVVTSLLIAAWLITSGIAVRTKVGQMVANGRQAQVVVKALQPVVEAAPQAETIVLVRPQPTPLEYSVFLMHDFMLIKAATDRLAEFMGRPDVTLTVESTDPSACSPSQRCLTLNRNGQLVPIPSIEPVASPDGP